MDALQEILGDYTTFLDDVLDQIESQNFDLNDLTMIDHLCYRVTNLEDYSLKKTELDSVATILGETEVNGRPISTYRLIEPIYHDIWRIDAIELPAPKPNNTYTAGLEHLEFVIYDDIATFLLKYEGKPFTLSAAERQINPEVSLQLRECSVKFHLLSLPAVVGIEQRLGIDSVSDEQL